MMFPFKKFHCTTLDNGLRVASQHMPGVKSASICVSIGVGSRHENAKQNGLSHLLEHMAFKGTESRDAQEIAEEFEDIGGDFNAYTSVENTVYYVRTLPEHLPEAAELLADIVQHSTLEEEELDLEKQVIIQEIAAHRDSPEDYIGDLFDAIAYKDQPIGRSVLGSVETVDSFTQKDVMDYMHQHYVANNMVVSAAGDIDHSAFVKLVRTYFSDLKSGEALEVKPTQYFHGTEKHKKDLEQNQILYGYPCPNQMHEDYYVGQLLANILGGGMSSRLFQEVRETRGLSYHIAAYPIAYSDAAILMMAASCAPENTDIITKLMQEQFEGMTHDIEEQELARAKSLLLTELAMTSENSGSVASWIGRHLLTYGEYRNLDYVMKRIKPVTVDDITRLTKEMLQTKPTLVSLGN